MVNYTADCGGVTATGTASPITVTGLTNGTSYTCKVKTTTTVGVSPWSANSSAVTPMEAEVIYFHNDISGSPMLATDANGAVVWKENYRTYGERLNNQEGVTTINSAITGKPLTADALAKSFGDALITAGIASGANQIGDWATGKDGQPAQIDAFTQNVAHAVLGCVAGSATDGNTSGCSAGAVGAVVGELSAKFYNPQGDLSKSGDTLAFAKTMAAVSGVLVGGGGDNVAAVNIAAATGANAAENNYLSHVRPSLLRVSEQEQYDTAAASCAKGDQSACGTRNELAALSKQRDAELQQACSGATPDLCKQTAANAAAMGNVVTTLPGGYTFANSPTSSALNTATIGAPTRPDSFQDAAGRSTSEALVLEVGSCTKTGGVCPPRTKRRKCHRNRNYKLSRPLATVGITQPTIKSAENSNLRHVVSRTSHRFSDVYVCHVFDLFI